MIPAIISILLLTLGLLRKSLIGFYLILLIPFSSFYYELVVYKGVFAYDFFFMGLFFSSFSSWIKNNYKDKINIYFILIILVYSFFSLFFNTFDKYFLRDYRPILLMVYAIIIFNVKIPKDKNTVTSSLGLVLTLSLILGIFFKILIGHDSNKPNIEFGFASLITYVSVVLVLGRKLLLKKNDSNNSKKIKYLIFISFIIILFSWNRTIILSVILIELIRNFKNIKSFFVTIVYVVLILSAIGIGAFVFKIDKILSLVSYTQITDQLMIRYGPAITYLIDMDLEQVFFGYGFKTLFEIPWFEFWGLDSFFNSVDNTYLTFFIKYGIIGLVLIFILLVDIWKLTKNFYLIIFLSILFLTISFPYQLIAIGLYLGIFFYNALLETENKSSI